MTTRDSRAFDYLGRAYFRFVSVQETASARAVCDLYRQLSGGCDPDNHVWPVSGPWCYCGRTTWKGGN